MQRLFSLYGSLLLGVGLVTLVCHETPTYGFQSTDYYHVTREEPLIQALEVLDQSSAHSSVEHIMNNDVRLVFKDMRTMGKAYEKHDAISWLDAEGHQYVFINQFHRGAPPQALAALISHEVMHDDQWNSVEEEVAGWRRECQTWEEMVQKYPELKQIKLKQSPLVDRENALIVLAEQKKLDNTVRTNKAYVTLPPHSPGF